VRLHNLQYLRAIASLFVVYSHAVLQVDAYRLQLHEFGGFGVDIFFVISGFIMVYIARPNDTPKRFLVSRAKRVIPLYWVFTLLMASILFFAPTLFKSTVFDFGQTLMSLLFIPHFSSAVPDMVWPILAPGWSLNYEMYFYLTFAAALVLPLAWRVPCISLSILLVLVAAQFMPSGGPINEFFRDTIVLEFILGMLLAQAYLRGFRIPNGIAWFLFIAGTALLLCKFPLPRIVTWGIPALLVVAGMLYSRLPANAFFVALGDASYALYLSHIFTLGLTRKILPSILGDGVIAAYLYVVISILSCIVVGFITHYMVDNWLLRLNWLAKFGRLRAHFTHS